MNTPAVAWGACRAAVAALVVATAVVPSLVAQPAERVRTPVPVTGIVFVDRNGNGVRDAGEPGIAGVGVSDQVTVATTDSAGRFAIAAAGYGLVFVTQPNGYRPRGPFWRRAEPGTELAIPMLAWAVPAEFTFIHASDTHLSEESLARTRRFRTLTDSLRPAFVLISGDLVRDALRVAEPQARGYFELLQRELAAFTVPVYTVPGNHDIFGIERHQSLVSPSNPSYGKRLYRSLLGPNYYSFDVGGLHILALDTVDYADLWYYGHVDSLQLAWIARDVARLPATTRVITFNHIPFVTAAEGIDGYKEDGPAPSVIRLGGTSYFRHSVQNTEAVLDAVGDRLDIALGGHMHRRELLRYETRTGTRRFAQTAAIVGPPRGEGALGIRSGITLYRVKNGHVDDGTFIPLDP